MMDQRTFDSWIKLIDEKIPEHFKNNKNSALKLFIVAGDFSDKTINKYLNKAMFDNKKFVVIVLNEMLSLSEEDRKGLLTWKDHLTEGA